MDKNKVRDQACKVSKDMKSSAGKMAKEVKKSAANTADNAAFANDDTVKKANAAKDLIMHTAQKVQADTKDKSKKADKINRDIYTGAAKGVNAYVPKTNSTLLWRIFAVVFAALLAFAPFSLAEEVNQNAAQSSDTILTIDPTAAENFDALMVTLDSQPSLRQVDMYDTKLTNAQMDLLANRYPDIAFGWTLHIGNHTLRTDSTAFSTLHNNKSAGHTSEDFAVLRYCKNLIALDVGHNVIADLTFLETLPKLRILILGRNKIIDTTPIGTLVDLEYLELFSCGVKDITALSNCSKLIDLNITNNGIDDLSPILGLPNLQRLWIFRSTGILSGNRFSNEEKQTILASVPQTCLVNFTSDGTGGGWRDHARYETIRKIFSTGVYEPFGDKGDDVLRAQQRIQKLGFFNATAVLSDSYDSIIKYKNKQYQNALDEESAGISTPELQAVIISDNGDLPTPSPTPVPTGDWAVIDGTEYRTLAYDSKGDDVLRLKQRMQELGYFTVRAEFSNYYNSTMKDKVQQYQSAIGKDESGIATPELQARIFTTSDGSIATTSAEKIQSTPQPEALSEPTSATADSDAATDLDAENIDDIAYRTLSLGDNGEDVLSFKQRLQVLGYFTQTAVVSDRYNTTMEIRVKIYQKDLDIKTSGIASPELQATAASDYGGLPTPVPLTLPPLPEITDDGFLLTEDEEFVYENMESGQWIYISDSLNIEITRYTRTGGSPLIWFETYIRFADTESLKRYNALEKYENKFNTEYPHTIAARNNLVLACSDDFYGFREVRDWKQGLIIIDGTIIADERYKENIVSYLPPLHTMALFADGSAKVFYGNEYSPEELLAMGTLNTLSFGPVLLQNGEIGVEVANGKYSNNEPRCALGMIEPRYYLLLTVEGRHKNSEGENLQWVAARMQELGVQEALNLDGGNTTALVFRGQLLNKIGIHVGNNYVFDGVRPVSTLIGIGQLFSPITTGKDE